MPQENSTLDREHFGPGDACAAGRDGTGPAVVVFDAEAMVVGINAEAEALLGRPTAEIVGQPLDTVIASGPQGWQALLAGDPKPEDMARAFRDSPLPHGAAGAPLNAAAVRCEPDQRPLWVAVLRDVAICSDMETALLEAEERLAG
ncbi:MAG: hypothetical protein K2Q10_14560, partial [Rhodospirillales bacterium]|nr:hypothetical protein [Rhodospirillales bacterium]